jgi:hypothetical protein
LPSDFGQITIMTVDQLDRLQTLTKQIDRLRWVLLLLTVVFGALALGLSLHRRRTMIALGLGAAVAFFVAFRLVDRLEANIVASVTGTGGQAAVRDLLGNVLSSLRALGWWVVGVGAFAALVAFLAGHPQWFSATGRSISRITTRADGGASELERWLARHADVIRVALVVVGALVLFAWASASSRCSWLVGWRRCCCGGWRPRGSGWKAAVARGARRPKGRRWAPDEGAGV